jgi:fucose permease
MNMALAQDDEATQKRKRGVRNTAIFFGLIAVFFYVGFIVLTLVRAGALK